MLSGQCMMPSLKKKWLAMSEDTRMTLEFAFRDGIEYPKTVPFHFCYKKFVLEHTVEFHHFRIGYATFIVAVTDNVPPVIWDVELDDGLPIHPAGPFLHPSPGTALSPV